MDLNSDYRKFLEIEYERRALINPHYSMRAFARDIDLSPSSVSEILSGKHGLSKPKAHSVAKKLGLTKSETENLIDMVEFAHARSENKKEEAIQRIRARKTARYEPMSLDAFSIIKDWYHFAILELTCLEGFNSDPKWIARSLNINQKQVDIAIERLLRVGVLKKDGNKLLATDEYSFFGNEICSEAIRKFHKQILEKALVAIDQQDIDRREYSALMLAVDSKDLPNIKKDLIEFRRDFSNKYENKVKKDRVYCLSTQFFEITN